VEPSVVDCPSRDSSRSRVRHPWPCRLGVRSPRDHYPCPGQLPVESAGPDTELEDEAIQEDMAAGGL
jgi:hypothetical protein